jgi:hypothetical protein
MKVNKNILLALLLLTVVVSGLSAINGYTHEDEERDNNWTWIGLECFTGSKIGTWTHFEESNGLGRIFRITVE